MPRRKKTEAKAEATTKPARKSRKAKAATQSPITDAVAQEETVAQAGPVEAAVANESVQESISEIAAETAPEASAPMEKPKKTRKPRTTRKAKIVAKNPPEEIIIQHEGSAWDLGLLKEKVYSAFVADGHRRGNIKKLVLYVKPEERRIYYVVNEKVTGSIDFE